MSDGLDDSAAAMTATDGRREARITVNGEELSLAEAMVVRVALACQYMQLRADRKACGPDAHGLEMRRLYLQNTQRVLRMLERP